MMEKLNDEILEGVTGGTDFTYSLGDDPIYSKYKGLSNRNNGTDETDINGKKEERRTGMESRRQFHPCFVTGNGGAFFILLPAVGIDLALYHAYRQTYGSKRFLPAAFSFFIRLFPYLDGRKPPGLVFRSYFFSYIA